jgi:hypothetical protein
MKEWLNAFDPVRRWLESAYGGREGAGYQFIAVTELDRISSFVVEGTAL